MHLSSYYILCQFSAFAFLPPLCQKAPRAMSLPSFVASAVGFAGLLLLGQGISCARSGPQQHVPPISIGEVETLGKTGDLLLWSGLGRDAMVVKGWSMSRFSHVGMLVKTVEGCFVWNADVESAKKDVLTGETTEGVQLNDFEESVTACSGNSYWLPLSNPELVNYDALLRLIRWNHGRKFDFNLARLLATTPYVGKVMPAGIGPAGKVFCSYLMGDTYKALGLLRPDVDTSRLNPSHFVPTERFREGDWVYGRGTFGMLHKIET